MTPDLYHDLFSNVLRVACSALWLVAEKGRCFMAQSAESTARVPRCRKESREDLPELGLEPGAFRLR